MGRSALIVVDMLNRYEHDDAEALRDSVRQVLPAISGLVRQAREGGALIVYVNDNHGDWTAGRSALSRWAMEGRDASLIEPIVPGEDMPFLVKARHSIFYATQLEYLLREHDVDHLVLVGQVTEQCILYSALDAYIRHFRVTVPRDAVAHIHPDLADAALEMMEINMRAEITEAAATLAALTADASGRS
ncbi:MAG TPA: isochorismatase family cysteine hydrolase [Baekduia sp.]|nr:isochorismatase family cysteine hydrolase [Baekduia sp.]